MPWRGPEYPGEFPTLGYLVADWIEAHCVIPDGDHQGEPYLLTDEMLRFLLWHYRIDPTTEKFTYRRSQLVRPQKWGKGPFAAAIAIAEAVGDVLLDGWDANGEPVGRPWSTPWIQVVAVSEDQTDNVWRALQPMIELSNLKADIPDTGLSRVNLPGGGIIEPVTSSASSRLGQRITFAIHDETHDWRPTNKGTKLADTQRRNLAGMNGRSIETTNAWDPSEKSVAQVTFESELPDVYRDMSAPPKGTSWTNKAHRAKAFKAVYGNSWWVDLDRIDAEFVELAQRDEEQALRFFGNMVVAGSGAAVDAEEWAALADYRDVPSGSFVGLGFDGSISQDCTALVGCTQDFHVFVLGVWERPKDARDWVVPRAEVHAKVEEAFSRFNVGLMLCDPPKWWTEIDGWAARFGEDRVVMFDTNQDRRMAPAVDRFLSLVGQRILTHEGDETLTAHVTAAHKRKSRAKDPDDDNRTLYTLTKPGDGRKIDAAVGAVLAVQAAATMPELEPADPGLVFAVLD